jgi:hypothetical protein
MKSKVKWTNDTQFAATLDNVPYFVDGLVARLHALKSKEVIQVDRQDAYDSNNAHQNTVFKISATTNESADTFRDKLNEGSSMQNDGCSAANEAITISDSSGSVTTPSHAESVAAADVVQQAAAAFEEAAALEATATLGAAPEASMVREGDNAIIDDNGSDDLMMFSQQEALAQSISSEQGEEEEGRLFPGYLLLVISVNYAAAKVVVDGPYAKWFHEAEYESMIKGAENITKQVQKVAIQKKSASPARRSARAKVQKSMFTPSKATKAESAKEAVKEAAQKGWQANIDHTINGIDDAVTNLQEQLDASVMPILEENQQLKSQCAELKSLILDTQAQAKNRQNIMEKALVAQQEQFTSMFSQLKKDVADMNKSVTSKLDRQSSESAALKSEMKMVSSAMSDMSTILSTQADVIPPSVNGPLKPRVVDVRRVANIEEWMADTTTLYVGRGDAQLNIPRSKWGNPFRVSECNSLQECLDDYARYVQGKPSLMESLPEIIGKQLGCHCESGKCHAEVLIALAESQAEIPKIQPIEQISTLQQQQPQYLRQPDQQPDQQHRYPRRQVAASQASQPNSSQPPHHMQQADQLNQSRSTEKVEKQVPSQRHEQQPQRRHEQQLQQHEQ